MTTLATDKLDAADAALDERNKTERKRMFLLLAGTVLVCGASYGAYEHFYAAKFISISNVVRRWRILARYREMS